MEDKRYGVMDFGTPHKTIGGLSVYRKLAIPQPEWLVDDLIIEHGHHVIFGYTGMKKSFLAMDLALRLINGMDYHGRKTTPCEVVYIVGEDAPEFVKRQDAWLKHHGKDREMNSIPHPVQFKGAKSDEAKFDSLIEVVGEYNAGLVIFDNLADVTVGIKTTDNDEYNEFVKPLRKGLTAQTGAATLFIHHTGKDKKSARGAQTIIDDANLSMKVGESNGLTTLTMEKLRGADDKQPRMFFESVPVDTTIVLTTARNMASGKADAEAGSSKSETTGKAGKSKRKATHRQRMIALFEQENWQSYESVAAALFDGNAKSAKVELSRNKGKGDSKVVIVNRDGRWGIEAMPPAS